MRAEADVRRGRQVSGWRKVFCIAVHCARTGKRVAFITNLTRYEALAHVKELTTIGLLKPSMSAKEICVMMARSEAFENAGVALKQVPLRRGYEIEELPAGYKDADLDELYRCDVAGIGVYAAR